MNDAAKAEQAKRATDILKKVGSYVGQDFDALVSSQVTGLLDYADAERYRKPKNANGSRGRCYFQRLQRLAAKVED